jgi:hypothetical protein
MGLKSSPRQLALPELREETMATQITATVTATVERIAAAATTAGLKPHTRAQAYRGVVEMLFDDECGPDGTFGHVEIGARSGRVLRGFIRFGNDGEHIEFTDGRHAARVLRALPADLDHELAYLLTVIHDGDYRLWGNTCWNTRPRAQAAGLITPTADGRGYRLTPLGFRELTRHTIAAHR